jgi:hypothetical protein
MRSLRRYLREKILREKIMMNVRIKSYLRSSPIRLVIAAAILTPLILFQAIAVADTGGEVLFEGPIAIDPTTKNVLLMGQALPATQLISDLNLHDGQYISVYGRKNATEVIEITQVRSERSQYVAGASPVIVTGQIAEIDKSHAIAKIGDLLVNYAPLLYDVNLRIEKGMFTTISGTQPNPSGKLLATYLTTESTSARVSAFTNNLADLSDPTLTPSSQTPARVTRIGSMGSGRIIVTTPVSIGSMGSGAPIAQHPQR